MQTENGDQRRKAYDIFPQIVICDEFMRRVQLNQDWTIVDPYEVKEVLGINLASLWGEEFEKAFEIVEANVGVNLKLFKIINARKLFKNIMHCQIETGLPYLAFKDTINRNNPNKHEGYIPGVNLCVESFSNVTPDSLSHCCNLVSLNLANLELDELEHYCDLSVRLLDNCIDITDTPIREAKDHNNRYRTVGVGTTGLADYLAKSKLTYTSTEEIDSLYEHIAFFCTKASMILSKERGAYNSFEGSEWSKGIMLGGKDKAWFTENASPSMIESWNQLREDILQYGIRNSHITAIAPNTSSSLIQGCTASILPTFNKFFYDKTKHSVPIAPPFIKTHKWFYRENKYTDQAIVVEAVSHIQKWIDTGVSMELVFNLNEGIYKEEALTARDIYNVLISAWQKGCKAVYYVRTIQKDDVSNWSSCESCAG